MGTALASSAPSLPSLHLITSSFLLLLFLPSGLPSAALTYVPTKASQEAALLPVFSPPSTAARGIDLMSNSDHVSSYLQFLSAPPPTVYEKRSTLFNLGDKILLLTSPDSSPIMSQLFSNTVVKTASEPLLTLFLLPEICYPHSLHLTSIL